MNFQVFKYIYILPSTYILYNTCLPTYFTILLLLHLVTLFHKQYIHIQSILSLRIGCINNNRMFF